MSVAAFLFVITLASFVVTSITASFPHCISCPCGSTNQNYTQCIDKSLLKKLTCERWSHCQTCKANTTFCITCPQDRSGPTCTKISGAHIRRKRQDGSKLLNYPRQSGSCPFLEQPYAGSIRCSPRGNDSSCTAQCLPGYHFKGTRDVDKMTLRCQGGIWGPQSFFPSCKLERQRATCPDPGIPRGGSRLNTDGSDASYTRTFEEGESVISCCSGDGFALQGTSFITCLADGTWSANRPQCVRASGGPNVYCPDPGYIQFGSHANEDGSNICRSSWFNTGHSVVFYCQEGYELVGNSLLTCLPSGRWSSKRPICRRIDFQPSCPRPTVVGDPPSETSCRHPGVDLNGIIEDHPLLDPQTSGQTFPTGTGLRFRCNDGYTAEGPTILMCQSSGEWTSAPPTCRRITTTTTQRPTTQGICRHPGVDVNGRIEGDPVNPRERRRTFPVGSTLTFSCIEGFEPEGPTEIRCLNSGAWSSNPPSCRIISEVPVAVCPVPEVDPNGIVEEFLLIHQRYRRSFEPGAELHFTCRDGYDLVGPSVILCLENGRWSNPPPTCSSKPVEEECLAPEVDPNGIVNEFLKDPRKSTHSFECGTELTFRCLSGYVLAGRSKITCGSNGQWSSPSPSCHKTLVANGDETLAGDWPWTVAIAAEWNGNPQIVCGGALLDSRTVLTAAHCLTEAKGFTLYFGKHYRSVQKDDKEVQVRRSYRIISHPGFNSETFDNDIAIVKFYPDVSYSERIQPICLPTQDTTNRYVVSGRRGYVAGWGLNEHQLLSDQLMLAHLPVQSDEACREAYNKRNLPLLLNAGKFCAGNKEGVTSACRGDSGSPMVFYERETDRHFIEGIVSFGITGECVGAEKYTVFAKVSQFTNWILQNWGR